MTALRDIPFLGVGVGYRGEIRPAILNAEAHIDFLELIAEHFMYRDGSEEQLGPLCEQFRLVPHCLGLSVGSPCPPTRAYLEALRRLCEFVNAPFCSDHLAMTRAPGVDLGHLAPIVYSHRMVEVVSENVDRIQQLLARPLILENITYEFELPGAELTQPEFFCELTRRTGCGILMDLTNLYINASNHGFDAGSFLEAMPADSIVQVHLAGGKQLGGRWVDSHSELVNPPVWPLLEKLTARLPLRAAVVERDRNLEDFEPLQHDMDAARRLMARAPKGTHANSAARHL